MRITNQLLRKSASSSLEDVAYLNLSGKSIVAIEHLSMCCQLQTLVLSDNNIDAIRNVECCRQLWCLDLSGNRIKSVHGLSRFPVLGMLSLAHNDLDWQEIRRLSHMRILSLTLVGNNKLTSDPHYRKHVVDLLPHLWMLDGRLITAEERKKVAQFFVSSQSSSHPIRRKVTENVFVPSTMKNLLVTGVFGEKSTHLLSRFPISYVHNIEMDRRRLEYLAYTIQQEMKLELQCGSGNRLKQGCPIPKLESLLTQRGNETEQCNMLLLLLLASLEYNLPQDMMKATLETAKLTEIGDVDCMEFFTLPSHMMLDSASLLLSAAAIDREENKDGGLYDQLYRSLSHAMERAQRRIRPQGSHKRRSQVQPSPRNTSSEEAINSQLTCLLASEVVHLMCLIPLFFESLESHEGLMRMVSIATKNPNAADVIGGIAWRVQSRGGDVWEVYHDIASYLLQTTSENVVGRKNKSGKMSPSHLKMRSLSSSSSVHRTKSQLIESTRPKYPPRPTRALSAGAAITRKRRTRDQRSAIQLRPPGSPAQKPPGLGDIVQVGTNQVARIVALPESGVAVLQIQNSTFSNSSASAAAPDAYFYVDTQSLTWHHHFGCWVKENVAFDSTRCSPSPDPHTSTTLTHHDPHSSTTLTSTTSLEGSTLRYRPSTPELYPGYISRPQSQMSAFSDDLETIPSQEELSREVSDLRLHSPPMRVNIATSSNTALHQSASKVEHQKSVLRQFSINQSETTHTNDTPFQPDMENRNGTPTHIGGIHHHQQLSNIESTRHDHENDERSLEIPTPQLQFPDTWASQRSLASNSYSRPHSCQQTDSMKQAAMIEPHMSHTLTPSPPSPTSHLASRPTSPLTIQSTISTLSLRSVTTMGSPVPPQQDMESTKTPDVVYNAWTVAKSNVPTKHTQLTASRLMTRRQSKTPPGTRKKSGSLSGSNSRHTQSSTTSPHYKIVLQQQQQSSDFYRQSGSGRSVATGYRPLSGGKVDVRVNHQNRTTGSIAIGLSKFGVQQPSRDYRGSKVRRLGDVRELYVGGSAIA